MSFVRAKMLLFTRFICRWLNIWKQQICPICSDITRSLFYGTVTNDNMMIISVSGILSSFSQWFLRPTQDLAVIHRRQEAIRFFTSPQNSDVLNTLQSSLRNLRNIPVTWLPVIFLTFLLYKWNYLSSLEHRYHVIHLKPVYICVLSVSGRLFSAVCLSLTPKRLTGRVSTRLGL